MYFILFLTVVSLFIEVHSTQCFDLDAENSAVLYNCHISAKDMWMLTCKERCLWMLTLLILAQLLLN